MSDSTPLIPKGIGDTPEVDRKIGQWVRQHEANQRNGNALTDAVKPKDISPEGIAQQREEQGSEGQSR